MTFAGTDVTTVSDEIWTYVPENDMHEFANPDLYSTVYAADISVRNNLDRS